MAKEKHSDDKISEGTLHEILLDIKYRLDHIEDIGADNRDFIVKLIKQGNQIVRFLSSIDVEPSDDYDEFEDMKLPPIEENKQKISERFKSLRELVDEFMNKQKDLQEFEEELEKHKDDIIPGQIGES